MEPVKHIQCCIGMESETFDKQNDEWESNKTRTNDFCWIVGCSEEMIIVCVCVGVTLKYKV